MEPASVDFVERLGHGPAVLLLGQRHLAMDGGPDPLLAMLASKHGVNELGTYGDMLDLGLAESPDATLAWMAERCRQLSSGESLNVISDYPWSAVVTSAIDTVLQTAFRRPWRDVQPVLDERHQPADPRNRRRLHCFYLYGNVNGIDARERVPLTPFELARRKQIAISMARRLPDLVTPLGTLAIAGYGGAADWLRPEDLASILADLNPGQVHVFRPDDALLADAYFAELQRLNVVVAHTQSLASTLAEGVEIGLIQRGQSDFDGEPHQIRVGSSSLRVPTEIWKRMRSSTTILDDEALISPKEGSPDARYRDFRAFLGAGEGVPAWDGLARGFAFTRDFEAYLTAVARDALASPGDAEKPVILHGPTGSGKTIALATLARNLRLEYRYPVLYIERRVAPPYADLDFFCEWAEQEGADATLIAWDGMLAPGEYRRALQYLKSRGRNAVVVGTTYRILDEDAVGATYVAAPQQLTVPERERFVEYLRSFGPGLDGVLAAPERMGEDAFLVALYRLLPPTRGAVRAGVSREMRHAERVMAEKAGNVTVEYRPATAMARALLDAGLLEPQELSTELVREVGTEMVDGFEHLTGLVMVPGRFGLRVPLELLMRAMDRDGVTNFLDLLGSVDIFRWYEDAAGNIEIGPRNQLEATLIAEARTGGPETEVALVRELLLEVRQVLDMRAGGREVEFAVSLLRAMGPGGSHAATFAGYFGALADALYEARTDRGLLNARLLLQEANLRREAAMVSAKGHRADTRPIKESLLMAEEAAQDALGMLPREPQNRALRSLLLVELASTLGTRAAQQLRHGEPSDDGAVNVIEQQKAVVSQALLEDPSNFHSVDVLAWTTRDAIRAGVLEGVDKVEAIADVMSAFQATDVNELEPRQAVQFHARRYEIAALIGDEDLSASSAAALKERGSGAAILLQALRTSGLATVGADGMVSVDRAAAAVEELDKEEDLVWQDDRCLDLYLDLWWLARTGHSLFDGERLTPGLTSKQWRRCLAIVESLSEDEASRRPAILGFLRALALFHLERTTEAFVAFKDLERKSMAVQNRRRVVRSYLASTKKGVPQVFHGAISWLDGNKRKGDVQVEELRRSLTFITHDFRLVDPQEGLDLGEFHIAFNFLGPIADPAVAARQA